MSETRTFIVPMDAEIVRIDKFLSAQMPEFSRSEIQRFVVRRTDGNTPKFSEKIRPGDEFVVEVPAPQTDVATENISTDFELEILFEDDDIIVINKPRGVVMYPSAGNKTGTLVQNILAHIHLSALGGDTR
ncbi:MAG: RNA pseudouridine synthase, partial [Alphaproteobacteria bacterium]|nr:RNA pseudouridine synthase [Alphaproteobacteria bacterium]